MEMAPQPIGHARRTVRLIVRAFVVRQQNGSRAKRPLKGSLSRNAFSSEGQCDLRTVAAARDRVPKIGCEHSGRCRPPDSPRSRGGLPCHGRQARVPHGRGVAARACRGRREIVTSYDPRRGRRGCRAHVAPCVTRRPGTPPRSADPCSAPPGRAGRTGPCRSPRPRPESCSGPGACAGSLSRES